MKPRNASSLTTRWIRPYGLAVASVATALTLALLADHEAQKNLEVPPFLMAIATRPKRAVYRASGNSRCRHVSRLFSRPVYWRSPMASRHT
jgi:hypothetical protein